ncbi:MAG: hypothetical protein ABS81_03500 [Pseudonocardia sp. SCN 72-86]|nr:MAG: hypothetical protein ABS81_03500 [Pseudonocardia sp. SCN 72-86]
MQPVTIGAVQLGPSTKDKTETVARMVAIAERAAEANVNVLCFPELALSQGFFGALDESNFDDQFDELPSPLIEPLLEVTRSHEMVVILPYAERAGYEYYNSALVFDADGTVAGKYRKTHISAYFPADRPGATGSYERLYFKPSSDGFPVFQTRYGKIGVQICYDRFFPEGSRALALKGAEIVSFPVNYSTYGLDYRKEAFCILTQARAYENGFFAVLPNKAGIEGDRESTGSSKIISPIGGKVLAEASVDKEELIIAEVDLDTVREARRKVPFWRDRRPEMYGELV